MLVNTMKPPGIYTFKWDGKNHNDNSVSSGLYLLRLEFSETVKNRKILLLKWGSEFYSLLLCI